MSGQPENISSRQKRKRGEIFRRLPAADLDLATDIRSAILADTPKGGAVILWLTLILFVSGLVWAYFAEVEEVTRADGKVVPSRQLQTIQNLEGGILSEIKVKVGEVVEPGQLLLRIDATRFLAPFQESRTNYLALKAKIARFEAEINQQPMVIPEEVMAEKPEVGEREQQLFQSRQNELAETLGVLNEQIVQRSQEIAELKGKVEELYRTHQLVTREITLTEPLVASGVVSEVEFLRLQRQDSEMRGQITASELAIPRAQSKLQEARRKIQEEQLKFTNGAKLELNQAYTQIESISATSVALSDRLQRTSVLSPVRGIINQIFVNTVGGVIQPGMDLIQIVPLDDTLLVEAKVKPADIAFIRPDLQATVKLTAYDFISYGGLQAQVEHISADSIVDELGNSFYLVNVRTTQNYLGTSDSPLPIIPGMVASVDILTGKKRVLTYLIKPILRAQNMALRER